MELSDILNSLESGSGPSGSFTKTASSGADDLSMAIDRALGSANMEKTAGYTSHASPAGDLMKVASSLAEAEGDALVKEANVYGAAVADGFMSRMSVFEKTASATDNSDYMIKQAYDQGYADTANFLASSAPVNHNSASGMEKEAAFEEGFNDTIKEAAFEEGFNDTVKEAADLTKVAAVVEEYGFNYGNNILNRL